MQAEGVEGVEGAGETTAVATAGVAAAGVAMDQPQPQPQQVGWGGVQRLQVHRRKMQEMRLDCDRAVLVMVHAHVSLKDTLAAVRTTSGECAAVILPCCNWFNKLVHPVAGIKPDEDYEDMAVVSPQRNVRVFASLPCGVSDTRRAGAGAGLGGGVAAGGDSRDDVTVPCDPCPT